MFGLEDESDDDLEFMLKPSEEVPDPVEMPDEVVNPVIEYKKKKRRKRKRNRSPSPEPIDLSTVDLEPIQLKKLPAGDADAPVMIVQEYMQHHQGRPCRNILVVNQATTVADLKNELKHAAGGWNNFVGVSLDLGGSLEENKAEMDNSVELPEEMVNITEADMDFNRKTRIPARRCRWWEREVKLHPNYQHRPAKRRKKGRFLGCAMHFTFSASCPMCGHCEDAPLREGTRKKKKKSSKSKAGDPSREREQNPKQGTSAAEKSGPSKKKSKALQQCVNQHKQKKQLDRTPFLSTKQKGARKAKGRPLKKSAKNRKAHSLENKKVAGEDDDLFGDECASDDLFGESPPPPGPTPRRRAGVPSRKKGGKRKRP